MNSFLELPCELVEEIFKNLNDKTLLAMREVSHITKDIAHSIVLNRSRQIDIDRLIVIQSGSDAETIFEFRKEGTTTLLQSKLYIISAINYLELMNTFDFDETRKTTQMCAFLRASETLQLFDYIAPLMGGARCNIKELFIPSYKLFKLTSAFLKGKTIPTIRFTLDDSDLAEDYALLAVREFGSTTVIVDLEKMPSDQYLADLSKSVDTIRIFASNAVKRELSCAFFHNSDFACNILRNRCSRLEMTESLVLKLDQMELRHQIGDKSFFFSARHPGKSRKTEMKIIIGDHLIHMSEHAIHRKNARNLVYLKHVDMNLDA